MHLRKVIPILLFLSFFGISSSIAQEIKINEIMASNSLTIADEDGDFSDWVELYNVGPQAVVLSGYGLTDDSTNIFKWVFPEITIQPQEFLLVWASGKDRVEEGSLHTNFSISANGETLSLSHPDGTLIDEVPAISIPTDVSYGRQPDGNNSFLFFTTPTPGQANHESGFGEKMEGPQFSHEGGFYAAPFNLTITSTDPSATIVYTLDGSEPDPENISGTTYTYKNQYPQYAGNAYGTLIEGSFKSNQYSSPIYIDDRSGKSDKFTRISSTYHYTPDYFPDEPVFKGTVVKARAIKPEALSSEVITNTYFIDNNENNKYSLPVIALSIQEDLLFDYEKGIYVAGKDFDDWRASNPSQTADGGKPANYTRSGNEWEYPVHIEIFDGSKGRVISQGAGMRLHGGWSRSHPAKSIRLYASNQYGGSHFEYPFFPNENYSMFKRILLRNSGNDYGYTMFRDAAIQSIVSHMNFETMDFQPSILFINSEYWGLHNIRERFDKYYFERRFGVDPENLDILEGYAEVDEGNADHYLETLQYISSNGLSNKEHYDYIRTRIDVNSFIDYQITQIFVANGDWPGNNIKFWRLKTSQYDSMAPKGHDGRWRWMLYDTDFGLGLYDANAFNENMLTLATATHGPHWPNPPWSTFLFREFLKNETFKHDFINRFSDQLNTAFRTSVMKEKINNIKTVVEPEIEEHIRRWKSPSSIDAWNNNVNRMLTFVENRPSVQRNHLKSFFNLGNEYNLTVNVSNPNHGYVKVNSLILRPGLEGLTQNVYPWSGKYFGGVPIELEAIAAPGYKFSGWSGSNSSSTRNITLKPTGTVSLTAMFEIGDPILIHYWNFNDEENLFVPTFTALEGTFDINLGDPAITEVISGSDSGFEGENAKNNDDAGSHLRVNDPLNSDLIFSLPTSDYTNISINFEARRSGQGAGILVFEYTEDGENYIEKEQFMILDDVPSVYTIDFTAIEAVNNNEHFGIKIKFLQGEGGTSGNNRFDNFTVEGYPIEGPVLSVVEEKKKDITIETFPNPFESENTIRINVQDQSQVNIVMQDLKGQIRHEIINYDLTPGTNEISMKLHNLAGGIYLVQFQFKNYKTVYKLIKL